MDIMELAAIGELVGGVAVIASLVYVGLQVRHSAQVTQAHAVSSRLTGQSAAEVSRLQRFQAVAPSPARPRASPDNDLTTGAADAGGIPFRDPEPRPAASAKTPALSSRRIDSPIPMRWASFEAWRLGCCGDSL
jgi:hypothetical protein